MSKHTTPESSIKLCECGCGQPAPIAKQSNRKLGHIAGQPVRFIVGHHNKVRPHRSIAERFWEKVDRRGPDDCWLWTASTDRHGYGQLQTGIHDKQKMAKAPRIAWELHYGPIPDGMLVCHNCPGGDNPLCVNPAHLFLGTYSNNIQDAYDKGQRVSAFPNGPGHGEDHPSAHFTNAQVRAWRQEFEQTAITVTEIAKKHDIPRTTMDAILKYRNYRHI